MPPRLIVRPSDPAGQLLLGRVAIGLSPEGGRRHPHKRRNSSNDTHPPTVQCLTHARSSRRRRLHGAPDQKSTEQRAATAAPLGCPEVAEGDPPSLVIEHFEVVEQLRLRSPIDDDPGETSSSVTTVHDADLVGKPRPAPASRWRRASSISMFCDDERGLHWPSIPMRAEAADPVIDGAVGPQGPMRAARATPARPGAR